MVIFRLRVVKILFRLWRRNARPVQCSTYLDQIEI